MSVWPQHHTEPALKLIASGQTASPWLGCVSHDFVKPQCPPYRVRITLTLATQCCGIAHTKYSMPSGFTFYPISVGHTEKP